MYFMIAMCTCPLVSSPLSISRVVSSCLLQSLINGILSSDIIRERQQIEWAAVFPGHSASEQ